MCSYITEKARIFGSAKGRSGWMNVDTAVVYYDHPTHVQLDHALNIDIVNSKTHERVAIELSAASARELVAQLLLPGHRARGELGGGFLLLLAPGLDPGAVHPGEDVPHGAAPADCPVGGDHLGSDHGTRRDALRLGLVEQHECSLARVGPVVVLRSARGTAGAVGHLVRRG